MPALNEINLGLGMIGNANVLGRLSAGIGCPCDRCTLINFTRNWIGTQISGVKLKRLDGDVPLPDIRISPDTQNNFYATNNLRVIPWILT